MQTRSAGILLAVVLVAYTLQTELASHVQHGLGYKKPYFLFYLTHSSYLLLFPLHLAALAALSRSASVPALLASLATTLEQKFQPPSGGGGGSISRKSAATSSGLAPPSSPKPNQHVEHRSLFGFVDAVQKSLLVRVRAPWIDYLAKRVLLLTLLISAPALSWYGAVPLTSMTGKSISHFSATLLTAAGGSSRFRLSETDITAIYNVFAFVRLFTPMNMADETPLLTQGERMDSGPTFSRCTTSPRLPTSAPRLSSGSSISSPSSSPSPASLSSRTVTPSQQGEQTTSRKSRAGTTPRIGCWATRWRCLGVWRTPDMKCGTSSM
jgi:hypothetical protein